MTFNIKNAIEKIRSLGYKNEDNLNILKNNNTLLISFFLKKLYNHSIYKFLIKEKKINNIDFEINEEIIIEIINYRGKNLDKKLSKIKIINFKIGNYKIKNKKLKQYLKRFYYSNIINKYTKTQEYIIKLKLGYITINKFIKNLINYIYDNQLIKLYEKEIIDIINFVKSKTKIYKFTIKNKFKLFEFIRVSVTDFYNIFTPIKLNQLLILNSSDNMTLFGRQINYYINIYNSLYKNKLEQLPYFTNFKSNSSEGYYYEDIYRDLYWDYNNSNNWYLNNSYEILCRIDKNTKYYTLLSLYYNLIQNNINKEILHNIIINNLSNTIKNDFMNKINITSDLLLSYYQEYYTHSIIFKILFKLFEEKNKMYKGINFIINSSYNHHCYFGKFMIFNRIKKKKLYSIIE